MAMILEGDLCIEARNLQEIGNELIARAEYDEATLGRWVQGPMEGFSNNTERPTTVLTTPHPWLPDGDAERLVEVSGLEYPIFSIGSAALYDTELPTVVTVTLGGTMNQSLFRDRGKCYLDLASQRPNGMWGIASFAQDARHAETGAGYDELDILGILDRIRQAN